MLGNNGKTKKVKIFLVITVLVLAVIIAGLAIYSQKSNIGLLQGKVGKEKDEILAAPERTGTCGGCSWKIDTNGVLTISKTSGGTGVLANMTSSGTVPWYTYKDEIKEVKFGTGVSSGTELRYMFTDCTNLKKIDFTNFNTNNATNMFAMMGNCTSLETINFGTTFKTDNVTNMQSMFLNCKSLGELDLTGFNTANVTVMWAMFRGCESLVNLDLSSFNTSNVKDMGSMFYNCNALEYITFGDNFKTNNVENMNDMFDACFSLKEIDLSNFNTSNVKTMNYMFYACRSLKEIDLSSFDTRNVTQMMGLFNSSYSIEELDISGDNFSSEKLVNREDMFFNTGTIKKIKIGKNFDFKLGQIPGDSWGRGSWIKEEDGKIYSAVERCYKTSEGESARNEVEGTYTKVSNVSNIMNFNHTVDYKIIKLNDISEEDFSTNYPNIIEFFTYNDQKNIIFKDIPLTQPTYDLPSDAYAKVIIRNALIDANEKKYDLEVKVTNLHFEDLAVFNGTYNGVPNTRIDKAIADPIGFGNSVIALWNYFFYASKEDIVKNSRLSSSTPPFRFDITLRVLNQEDGSVAKVINEDSTQRDGKFIFSAYDIDVFSFKDKDSPLNKLLSDATGKGYGYYSEGINLKSGFDESTLTMLPEGQTSLQKYTFIDNGIPVTRITGSRSDTDSEISEFTIKANASGTTFTWTAQVGCGTAILSYYQPQIVELEKRNENDEIVPGAKLQLYYGDEEYGEPWITTDEPKKLFLNPGQYTLKEIETPEGYYTAEDVIFFVDTEDSLKRMDGDESVEVEDGKIVMTDNRRSDLTYTVRYYEKGTTNSLLPDNTVPNQVYQDVIQTADVIEEIDGFQYDSADKDSLTIGLDETANVITLYYTRKSDCSYTVRHFEKDTDNELCDPDVYSNQAFGSEIISSQKQKTIEGFTYDSADIDTLTIGANDEENVITLYYTRRNDLKYIIHYKEQGTETELLADKVVEDKEYEEVVGESAEDIEGYTAMTPTSVELTLLTDTTEHTFWYQKRNDLSYTVKHLDKDTLIEIHEDEEFTGITLGTEITSEDKKKTIAGYNYDSADKATLTVGVNEADNIIKLYYTKKTNIPYIVHYREEGTNEPVAEDKQGEPQVYGAQVTEEAKNVEGYNKVEPTSKTITIEDGTNEIIFYYVKRKDLSYTVKYMEKGTTRELEQAKVVRNQEYGKEITAESERKEIGGYVYDSSDKASITIGINEAENIITLYYVKLTGLSYTVNYWDKDTNEKIKETVTRTGKEYGDEVQSSSEKIDIEGYTYDSVDKERLVITGNQEQNVINFYYTKKNNLSYIVKYIDKQTNEEIERAKTVGGKTYNDRVLASSEIKEITGYIYDSANPEELIIKSERNELKLYYVKKNNLQYTVHYLEQGTNIQVAADKQVGNKTYNQIVTENAIEVEGYEKVAPVTQSIEIKEGTNEITFYYKKRNDLSYTVNYLEKGTNITIRTSKVQNGMRLGTVITAAEEVVPIEGYNYDSVDKQTLTIQVGRNEINIYYTKVTGLRYTVHYKEQGTGKAVLPDKTVGNQSYGDTVYENAVDVPGYKIVEPANQSLTIKVGTNEITFWYTKRNDLSYIVNYLEKGTNSPLKLPKVVNNVTFGTEIASAQEVVTINGYEYDSVDKAILTVGTDANENYINIYYKKRTDLSYIVRYLEKDTYERLRTPKTVENVEFGSLILTENEIEQIEGYTFHAADKDRMRITTDENILNLYYKKRTDLEYTIYYKEAGTEIQLKTPKIVTGQTYGREVKAENEVIDIPGYTYDYPDKNNIILGVDNSQNTITIYYSKITGLNFRINYLDKETGGQLAPSYKEGDRTYGDSIIATDYIASIDGYTYWGADKDTITIDKDESKNVINLYYTKRDDLSYNVNYIDVDTEEEIRAEKTQYGMKYGELVESRGEIIQIDGYTLDHVDKGSIRITTGDNRIKIYYKKRSDLTYTVRYLEKDTNNELRTAETKGGKTLGDIVLATDEIKGIEGYTYDSSDKESIEIGTGENIITLYYVKRTDLSYTVKYVDEKTNAELLTPKVQEGVTFGQVIESNNEVIDITGYEYKRADKETLKIGVENNVITLFYTRKNNIPYKVNYKEKGTNKVLERAKVGTAEYGQTITSESEVINITGYVYDSVDKDYLNISENESDNQITIYYVKDKYSYRVNFKDKESGATLRTSKVVNNVEFGSIIEASDEVVPIDGYTYDSAEEDTITITEGRNVITLYYLKNRNQAYTVYYKETGTNQKLHDPRTIVGQKFGNIIRAEDEVIDIDGYNYDYPDKYTLELGSNNDENTITIFYSKVTGIRFKINYLDKETQNPVAPSHKEGNMTFGDIVEARDYVVPVDGYNYDSQDKDSITIVEDETKNVINIYYTKKNDLSFKVNYQEKDTNQTLSPSKTVTGQTFGDEITARSQIIAIDGYNYYNSDKDSIKITTGNNEITLYYVKKNDLTYTVNYKELGTNEELRSPKLGTNKELGSQVTASSEIINIPGYDYNSADKNVLTITTGENVITLYYTKKNNLEYTVKYLEKDTNKVLSPAKVKDGATFGQKVYATNEIIDIDGYEFYTSDKDSITIKLEDNVITLYYKKKTNLSYKVNYLEKDTDQILKTQKVKSGKAYGDEVTASSEIAQIPGYDYDSSDKDILVIGTGTNEITLYYTKKENLSYRVNYLEKDTLKQLRTPKTTNNVTLGAIINATEQVVQIPGYSFDSADVDRLEIKPNDNVINLYYVKRNDLSYTVNYREARTNEVLQSPKTVTGQTFGKEILTANEIIDIEGYNYDYADKQNIIIGEDTNEITLYYSKVKGLNFKINYLDKDTREPIAPSHKEGDMTYGDKVEAEDYKINIDGYLFDSADKDEITIVEDNKQNVINIYYKRRDNLSYRVNYLEKDTNRSLRDQKVQAGNSYGDIINSRDEIVQIDGYTYDSISSEQLRVLANENTNVINIFYVKRNDLSYTVKYLEKDTNKELHRPETKTGKKFQDIVKASDEIIPIDGYNYSSTNYEQMVIGTGDNTLILYYKKRNDLEYKVNYLEKDTNKVLKTQKIQRNVVLGSTIESANEIVQIDGYEYNMADKTSIEITTGENVINLYYTKRKDLSYTVNFLEKGSNQKLAEPNTKTGITYGERINAKSEIIQIDGYNYDSIDKDFLDITTGENVINIYYSKRNDLVYKVNYLEKDTNEILRTHKRQDGMIFGTKIYATDEVVSIDGYSFVEADKEEITIGTTESKNVINLYYKKITGLPYIVNYIDKETRRQIKDSKIAGERTFGDVIRAQDEIIKIYGYDYDSADKQLLTISTGENVINLFYTKKPAEVEVHYYEEHSTNKVAPDKIISGKVGDSYRTTEPNTIDEKYELVEMPENRVGTMTEEPIEVIYFYRKKATTVTVHYYEEGTTNKVSENVVIEGRVDNPYTTKPAMDVPIKYELSITPENAEGVMTLQPIEVIYYYRVKDAQVNIKYVDKATGNEITEADILKGKVDEEYQTTPKDIMNFTLIEHSGNETGRYEVEPITVTYYYLQNTRATVQYIDKTTGLVIEESTQEGVEGDWFETTSKNFEGYVLVEEPEVKKVQMTKDHIILKYYYIHVSAGVIEKHVDMISGEILENTVHEGKVGDPYETYSKVFEGYDLVEEHLPQNSKGTMELDPIEVVYYYKRKTQVNVKYIDKVTGQEIEVPTVIPGHEKDPYTTEPKDLPDYVLDGIPENATGEMTIDPIDVIYYYKHTSAGVKVNYIDIKTGEKLADEIVFTGCESDPYKAEEKFFDGFDIVMERYPQNTEGTMTIDPIEVTYYYVKKSQVTVKYIDRETGREITDPTVIPGHEGDPYTTEPKVISGYDLMEEPKDKSGNIPRDPLEIVYYYARPAVVVVNYIDEDTNEKLADEIVINGHEGDEYTTEQKEIKYYKFDKTSGNEKGKMKVSVTKLDNGKEQVNDITEVTYYYKKMKFNMKVDKMIGDIILDGSVQTVNGKIGKAEIYRKNLGKANLRISYKIKVENTGEIAGKATVIENIPAGMTVNSSSNAKWQLGNNIAQLETEELKPGEFREYIIVLDWTKGESNLGTKDNTAEIIKTSNEAGFADVDNSDNKDKASVIITVGTGEHAYILITATAMIVLLGAGYVIYKKTKK